MLLNASGQMGSANRGICGKQLSLRKRINQGMHNYEKSQMIKIEIKRLEVKERKAQSNIAN